MTTCCLNDPTTSQIFVAVGIGDLLEIELLRPIGWLAVQEMEAGATTELDLPELGAVGPAQVLAVEPCPPIAPGPGNVITGRFLHSSAEVLDLYFTRGPPLGTTANHPFWSEDRQEYIPAGELQPDERVRTLAGVDEITALHLRPGRQPVYNIEVHAEHVYHVGALGVLVHITPDRI